MLKTCKKCGNEFELKYIYPDSRKYCFSCNPVITRINNKDSLHRICTRCLRVFPKNNENFARQGRNGKYLMPYCKRCHSKQSIKTKKNNKILAMKMFGSKQCKICGYSKAISALSFHHIDPSKKEGSIASISIKKLKEEVSKCILVCENCHREIHEGMHPQYIKRGAFLGSP